MAGAQASITVVGGSRREDYVLPVGMTIAGLLALIEVDLTDLQARLTLGGGRAVDPSDVIGRDIPSGSVVTIVGSQESAQAIADDHQASNSRLFQPAMASSAFVFAALILTLVGVAAPTAALFVDVGQALPPLVTSPWFRVTSGLLCALMWTAPLMTRKGPTSEFAHLGYCAAAGISLGVGITPLPGSLTFLPVIVSWSALVLAGLVLFTRPGASARVNVQAFGLIAATMTISSFSALGAVRIAPIVFAASIVFISLAPHLALQVPDHQVLDLPLVMKRLPTIRQTVIAPPSRITQARVKKTVREANTRSLSMLASATVIAFVSGVITAYQLPLNEEKPYAGYATLALCLLAIIGLLTNARAKRDRLTHYGPRVVALAMWATIFFAPEWSEFILRSTGEAAEPTLEMARYVALPLSLSVLAFITPVIALIRAGREPSALVGRILDIIQGISLTLLLPAATYGSGLFDLVWRKVL